MRRRSYHRLRFANHSRAALVAVLFAVVCGSLPVPGGAQDPGDDADTEEARMRELVTVLQAAFRHRATRRSVIDGVDPRSSPRADRVLAYKLRTTTISADFDKLTVEQMLDFLRGVGGFNFVISAKAREDLAAETRRISMNVNALSVENLLNLVDRQLKDHRFVVRYGAVILARNGEYRPRRIVRVYDVRDIVRRPPDFPAPRLGLGGIEED